MLPYLTYMVDPGGMTGIACLRGTGEFTADEFEPVVGCDAIFETARYHGRRMVLGWERYTITARTHKLTRQNAALEVIGVCKYAAWKFGCSTVERQQATPSKQEQEVLKRLGWWVEGKDDAQSAAGHMLRFVLDSGYAPPAVLDAVVNREKMNGKNPNRRGASRE